MLLFFLSEYKVSPCLPAELVILCSPSTTQAHLDLHLLLGLVGSGPLNVVLLKVKNMNPLHGDFMAALLLVQGASHLGC